MAKTKPKHWSECKTEAEEAKWWDEHPDYVAALIEKAAAAGTLRRGRRAIGVVDPAPRIPAKVSAPARSSIGSKAAASPAKLPART
jgi:hypothetical protein